MKIHPSLSEGINEATSEFVAYGIHVTTEKWQGTTPPQGFFEALGISFSAQMPKDITVLVSEVKPNLPWAEKHFQERINGQPLNPGEQYKKWPYYKPGTFQDNGKFTHTYMERYWPVFAGEGYPRIRMQGIRYEYGDLLDVVSLLLREPFNRQSYLPVWFPEDTGAKHGGRVPCTLGYLFMRRGSRLNVTYYIRSCDYYRHFRDDIYLTVRLVMWVLHQLKEVNYETWGKVEPGVIRMHIESLHIFSSEYKRLVNTKL
jgi:hypothetical protein